MVAEVEAAVVDFGEQGSSGACEVDGCDCASGSEVMIGTGRTSFLASICSMSVGDLFNRSRAACALVFAVDVELLAFSELRAARF